MLSAQSQPQLSKGVALITGAARGIGRGIALRLADDGFDVAVNDLPGTPELDEVIETIVNKGRRAIAIPGDVSDESAVIDMIQSTVQTLGSLDVVRFSNNLSPYLQPRLPLSVSVGCPRAPRSTKHLLYRLCLYADGG